MLITCPSDLARYIKNYRKKQGVNQRSLGETVGLMQSTISAFETRPESAKLETLFRILAASGLQLQVTSIDEQPSTADEWSEEW